MKFLRTKKLYLPALTIIAVVLILLVLISISTYRNLDREERSAMLFLHSQGVSLLRALEAGARTGMMMSTEDSVGQLIRETAKDESVAYLYMLDDKGQLLHHYGRYMEDVSVEQNRAPVDRNQIITRILKLEDGASVYELTKRFAPLTTPLEIADGRELKRSHTHDGDTIVLGLIMRNFDEIRRLDFHHAMIMAAILVITGSGALFFIVVTQNYYVVNRTLKQTQDYSKIVFTNMPIGLLSIDLEGKVVAYNPKVLEILGLNERAILKQRIDQIIDFQGFSLNRTPTGCATVLEKELFHRRNSDHATPISLSSTPIIDDNNICLGVLITIRDLSEIKRLEEKVRRSEKLAAVGELAAGLAHEIRNPLSSIRGFAQFFKHTLMDHPREQEYAQTMVSEIDRINRVVTDLLSMARPKKLELELADVGALVKRAADLVKSEAKSRNLFLGVFVQPNMQPVSVDTSLITQALLNLLLNAIQSVESGNRVAVGTELKSGDQLSIWVEDDGPGIPINLQQKVFEPFYTTREAGTGLGLAIIRSIAENHEGAVQLESPLPGLEHGCRFTITIPVRATVEA
jgi:two-component system, NtrC family, sensor histidine kinase HydH